MHMWLILTEWISEWLYAFNVGRLQLYDMCVCVCVGFVSCKFYCCVMCIWFFKGNDMIFWDYEIVIEIEYKWQVEHVIIYEIHVSMWLWIVKFWDVKLWAWDMVVNKCLVNFWCDITYIVNYTIIWLVFTLRKMFMCKVLKEKCRVLS